MEQEMRQMSLWRSRFICEGSLLGVSNSFTLLMVTSTRICLNQSKGKHGSKLLIIIMVLVASVLVVLILAFCLWKKRKNTLLTRPERSLEINSLKEFNSESHKEDLDLPFFRLSTLAEATNQFAINNKLRQGGFGPVFKEYCKTDITLQWLHAPEYAVDGLFSVKSDVFSFGVLILKIFSGRRNIGFIHICIVYDVFDLVRDVMV